MSGLYNMVLGDGKELFRGQVIAELLELDFQQIARYRDAWVENRDGMPVIAIYTRIGGNNRADYGESIQTMQAHPLYLFDKDDGFDSTYATFYFNAPEQYRDDLRQAMIAPVDTDKMWQDAIDRIGKR